MTQFYLVDHAVGILDDDGEATDGRADETDEAYAPESNQR